MNMHGLLNLAQALERGPQIVRAALARGDPHWALGYAHWLKGMGHAQADVLIQETQRAVRVASEQRVKIEHETVS